MYYQDEVVDRANNDRVRADRIKDMLSTNGWKNEVEPMILSMFEDSVIKSLSGDETARVRANVLHEIMGKIGIIINIGENARKLIQSRYKSL